MLCAKCNTLAPPGQRFCGECGNLLAAPVAEGNSPPPQDERRQVTILFADIAGFTALSEALDPEQVTSIINDCFAALAEPVALYGGTIDKYIGDEMMVLFGAPTAHEDDPARAVHCALAMIERIASFNIAKGNVLPRPLALHVGINSGLVVAGQMSGAGRGYTVVGDAVSVAARLEEMCGYNEVLVGETTRQAAADIFAWERTSSLQMRGKGGEMSVYRVLGLRAAEQGQRDVLRVALVGREEELTALERLARGLDEQGGFAAIFGEVGIGKSRLLAELRQRLDEGSNVRWVAVAGQQVGQQFEYQPWREAIQAICRLELGNVAWAQLHLRSLLEDLAVAELDETYAGLARLLGISGEGSHGEEVPTLTRSVERLLRATAARQPIILVLDDLHQTDYASLELLKAVAAAPEISGLLLVGSCRSDGGAGEQALRRAVAVAEGTYRARSLVFRLPALSNAESVRLITALFEVDGLPETVKQLLVERAGGNPLYIEEVIRSLIDGGQIHQLVYREGLVFRPRTGQLVETLAVPLSLEGVISARIDRLPAPARQVLQVAAVLGRRCEVPVLAHLLQREGQEVDLPPLLQELQQRELLTLSRGSLTFRHVLTQEVAYNRLLLNTRRLYHQTAANYYAALPLPVPLRARADLGSLFATFYHLTQAQDYMAAYALTNLPLLLGDQPLTLDTLLDRWGENASRRTFYRQLAPHLTSAEQIEVLTRLGRASYYLGELRDSVVAYAEGRRLAAEQGDLAHQSFFVGLLGNTYQAMGDYQAALDCYDQALPVAVLQGDRGLEGRWLNNIGVIYINSGQKERAELYFQQALAIAREIGDRRAEGMRLGNLSIVYKGSNNEQAIAAAFAALTIMRELGDRRAEAIWLGNLGNCYNEVGDKIQQAQYLEQAVSLARKVGDQQTESRFLANLGLLYCHLGRTSEAHDHLNQSLIIALRIADRSGEAIARGYLGLTAQTEGDLAQAEDYLRQGAAIATENGDHYYSARFLVELAGVLLTMGRVEEAQVTLQQVADDDQQNEQSLTSLVQSLQARIAARGGRVVEARAWVEAAKNGRGGLREEQAMVSYNLACAQARLGDCAGAGAMLNQAVEMQPRYQAISKVEEDLAGCLP